MPDIHIIRDHSLGLRAARRLAIRWVETAQEKLGMQCTYEEGTTADLVTFTRSGLDGELKVTADRFEVDARLGFLLGVFKERIEGEIASNLDKLLAQKEPLKAFEKALAERAQAKAAAQSAASRKKA